MLTSSLLQLRRSRGTHTPVAVPSLFVILDRQRSSAANSAQARRGREDLNPSGGKEKAKEKEQEKLFFRPLGLAASFSRAVTHRADATVQQLQHPWENTQQNAPGVDGETEKSIHAYTTTLHSLSWVATISDLRHEYIPQAQQYVRLLQHNDYHGAIQNCLNDWASGARRENWALWLRASRWWCAALPFNRTVMRHP